MLSKTGIKMQRSALEWDARIAAEAGEYDTWGRAIGGIVALDIVLQDREIHAAQRFPFPKEKKPE